MATTEQYSNLAQTVINQGGGIGSGDGTVTVADASGFPATGTFRIRIDTELIVVTSVSGNVFTITRGAESTTAASHINGSTVTQVLTRDGLKRVGTIIHATDTHLNRPSGGLEGRLFLPNNGFKIDYDNGTAFTTGWGPIYPLTLPIPGDFSAVNQGGSTFDTDHGGMTIIDPGQNGGDNARLRVKSVPGSTYTITALLVHNYFLNTTNQRLGLVWRQSSDGKFISAGPASNQFRVMKWNSDTGGINSEYVALPINDWPRFIQLIDDGSNRIVKASNDGINFIQIHSVGRTNFLTADQVGFFVNSNYSGVSYDIACTILSWKES